MAYSVWQKYIESEVTGLPVASPTITVRNQSDLSLATIYSTAAGAALANPFTGTTEGLAKFFAAGGFYKITATSGSETAEFTYEPIGQAMGYDVGVSTGQIPTVDLADIRYNPNLNHNLTATSAPTVNDDSSLGYEVQSLWVDISTSPDTRYICLDNTDGAAIWVQVYSSVGGTSADLITYDNATSGLAASDVQAALNEIDADLDTAESAIAALPTLAHGSWSPTFSDYTNCSVSLFADGYYSRVGLMVTVFCEVSIDTTSTGQFIFRATLPVAAGFGSAAEAGGSIIAETSSDVGVVLAYSSATGKFLITGNATTTSAQNFWLHASYKI